MNKQILLMKYHPAKKEIEFHRYQNGKEVAIRNDSKLKYYMNKKGKFVLQDHGNAFFNDIASAFDGLKSVDVQVVTTKLDYEDFEQMVEYYNAEPNDCKINATLLAELPDMNATYAEVRNYGEESIDILKKHRIKLFEVPSSNENVKKSAESFAKQIDAEVKNIREKIESLGDNNVSLCFTGVYSAGKSALINALIGYRILPEAVTSETAKMFKIYGPRKDEKIQISFDIADTLSILEWNEISNCFEFVTGPSESTVRTEIQKFLNQEKETNKPLHEQVRNILSVLNSNNSISPDIEVRFPVALDTNNVQFTIYDTPGTDSNYLAHQTILNEALAEQTQSILIFVAHPTKLEGEGNNALLNYLKTAEEKNSKTSIDIGRSLFVMNYADTVTATDRENLRFKEIKSKDDENFSIKLSDKKLFFTAARYAYAAKAVKNGVATSEEKNFYQMGQMMFTQDFSPYRMCFEQDRCATSECATRSLMEACNTELVKAKDSCDENHILIVASGLYALEREITIYGEKYASAVKAFAIIDSVDKTLTKLSNRANSLKESNEQEIGAIELSIKELKDTIEKAIVEAYNKVSVSSKDILPVDTIKALRLDSVSMNECIIGNAKEKIDKMLRGWFFGIGSVVIKDKDKDKVRDLIGSIIDDYTSRFFSSRKKQLEKQRDYFMTAIKDAIIQNGKISEAAKQYFLDIPNPQIKQPDKFRDVGEIYNSHKRTGKILFFKTEHLDKTGFLQDVEERLTEITAGMADDYGRDYRKALEDLLNQIRGQFMANLEEYSLDMKAMIEDREAMKNLGGRVSSAAGALIDCKTKLNDIIWKEIDNG